ncbi:T9SS type A sorting domain-containing protein [Brumimicrobium oceani]|uniref:Secretion protein n=1 Tax=Brumimicrobium oceani TaxID=2100725 RepID=A0A2U2XCA6_9FLAO|nr:T9SS type A sorting domain-containing protein [Brumimicrobium oceani]PWH85380.1 secretion protein [Brumimicrobium oceani]
MNKYIFILISTVSAFTFGQSYAPAAGQPGSTAIPYDDPSIVNWASNVEIQRGFLDISDTTLYQVGSNRASFGSPVDAVGPATTITTNTVSLGDSGVALVTFPFPITNGNGFDFAVFENGFDDNYLELAHVEVSSDGINYVRFPSHSETQTNTSIGGFGYLDPTHLYNLAGKYRAGWGTPFDLEELKDSAGLNVNAITHVKIIDVVGAIDAYGTNDSYGNKINDPYPTPFSSGGFDLSAIGVIHQSSLGLASEDYNFNIYPNPSNGVFTIATNGLAPNSLIITNSLGRIVEEINISDGQNKITVQLSKGVYFIHDKNSGISNSQRIIVQ